jgi:hypothetical protein
MKLLKLVPVVGLALAGTLAAPSVAGATTSHWHHGHHHAYVCSGGQVPAGNYRDMQITGVCYAEAGNVNIHGDLTVAPGALFDTVTAGDPTSSPVVPATVDVGGNVFVGKGAALLFGCSPNITCSTGVTYDSVRGNVTSFDAQGVVLHSASVGGDVSILGGGGGTAGATCAAQAAGAPLVTALEPWSEDPILNFTPVYSDVEDSTIGGDLTIAGLDSCWLGTLRNQIQGDARIFHNTFGDPDAMEVNGNVVQGNLACDHNVPVAQFGDGGSAPNLVGGHAFGECGFKVTDPSPAPTMTTPAGVAEHISVSLWKLSKYDGTIASVSAFSLPPATTSSNDTIGATIYNFTLAGSGLVGTGTYDSTKPPGATGEAVLTTTYPNGWTQFTAFLTCQCSFGGQSGTITVRAYGWTSPHGSTRGTFLVSSGGGPAAGSLSTLAGGGTFSSDHEPAGTLRLKEYLKIT